MDRTVVFNGALLRIGSANRAGLRPISGSADHVYVFAFQSGKPSVALSTATKSLIQVRQSEKALVVLVPPTTYPSEEGRFPPQPPPKEFSFPLEH